MLPVLEGSLSMVTDDGWGQQIRAQRETLGVSQAALARALGISAAKMCRWELEHTQPPPPAIRERVERTLSALKTEQQPPDDALHTAARIRSARLERGWTQAVLARRLGRSERSIGDWERGRVPDTLSLRSLAMTLEVSADWLLGLNEIPRPWFNPSKNTVEHKGPTR